MKEVSHEMRLLDQILISRKLHDNSSIATGEDDTMSNNEEEEEEEETDAEEDNLDMSNSSYNKLASYFHSNGTFESSPTSNKTTTMSKGKSLQSSSISFNLSSAEEVVDKSEHVDHYLPQQQQSSSSSSPFPIHDWWRQNYLLSSQQQQQLHWQRLSKSVDDETERLTSHVLSKPQLKVIQESSQFLH